MLLDGMLLSLLDQVVDVYIGTLSGKMQNVDKYTDTMIGVDDLFTIEYEPHTNSYTYHNFGNVEADQIKIRLSASNLLDGTVIYTENGAVTYKDAASSRAATKIQLAISTNVSLLAECKSKAQSEQLISNEEVMEGGRGSR